MSDALKIALIWVLFLVLIVPVSAVCWVVIQWRKWNGA